MEEEGYHSWHRQLFEENYQSLCRYAGSMVSPGDSVIRQEVEDIVQDVFRLLWQKRASLRTHENIVGWLFKTTFNKTRSAGSKHNRRAQRHAGTVNENADACPDAADVDPEALLLLQEQKEQIIGVIGEANYLFLLDYFDTNITSEALADRLGISISALRTRVHRIIKPLRNANFIIFLVLCVMLSGFEESQSGGDNHGAGNDRKSGSRSDDHRFLTFSMVAAIRDHESAKAWQSINAAVLRLCSLVLTYRIEALSQERQEQAWTAIEAWINQDVHRHVIHSRHVRVILVTLLLILLLGSICFAAFRPWIVSTLFGAEQVQSEIEATQQVSLEPRTYGDALGVDFVDVLNQDNVRVMLPCWIPEGYSLTTVDAVDFTRTRWEATARYQGNDAGFSIQISRYDSDNGVVSFNAEKDARTQSTKEVNGITVSIFDNLARRSAQYIVPPYVVVISGSISQEDLTQMIESMEDDNP